MIIPKHSLFFRLVSKKTVTFNQNEDIYLARRVEGEGKNEERTKLPILAVASGL